MSCPTNHTQQISQAGGSVGLPEPTNPAVSKFTFTIPDYRIRWLQREFKAISKRLQARGFPPVTVKTDSTQNHENADGTITRLSNVTVTAIAPVLGDWLVIGKTKGGEVAGYTPEPLPAGLENGAAICDACGGKRSSKVLYFLQNAQGDVKRVESSCLTAFTGHPEPQPIVRLAETLGDMPSHAKEFEENTWGKYGKGEGKYISSEKYLAYVVAAVRRFGYVPRSESEKPGGNQPTGDRALQAMIGQVDGSSWQPSEDDEECAREAIKWVREELAKKNNWDNEYNQNMVAQLSNDTITTCWASFVASLIPKFTKVRDRKRNERMQSMFSQHVGKVGERVELQGLSLMSVIPFTRTIQAGYRTLETTAYVCKFTDQKGNILIWYASNNVLEAGHTYQGTAFVKKHDEYQGTKQTVITRANFKDSNQLYND